MNDLHSKLAKIGLISPRIGNGIQSKFSLKNTCKHILKMGLRMGSMPKRLINGNTLLKHFFRFIPPSTDIRDITVLDAKNWYDSISNP